MSLLNLPNELLLQIVESLETASDIHSLICSNRRLNHLLTPVLRNHATHKKHVMSALFCAATIGDREMIRLILESGPPLTVLAHIRDKIGDFGIRVIYSAPMRCPDDVVLDRVIEHGVGIHLMQQWEPLLRTTSSKMLPSFAGTFPALHWAVFQGHYQMVRMLLDKGVDPNSRTDLGFTRYSHGWMIGGRYSNGAPHRSKYIAWGYSVVPLHIAAHSGHEGITKLLLDRGADMGAEGSNGEKSIHLAAQMGHEGVVRMLLARGANVNEPDKSNCLPLEAAALFEHEGVVRLLLENGADVSFGEARTGPNIPATGGTSDARRTVLHNLMLKAESPQLYEEWSDKRKRILRLLLEHGADPTVPDKYGKSARYIAQSLGDEDLVKVLSEKYPWHGVGFEYWKSISHGGLTEVGAYKEPELRRQRKQYYREWVVRRWCRQKQRLVVMDCLRVCRLLGSVCIRSKG